MSSACLCKLCIQFCPLTLYPIVLIFRCTHVADWGRRPIERQTNAAFPTPSLARYAKASQKSRLQISFFPLFCFILPNPITNREEHKLAQYFWASQLIWSDKCIRAMLHPIWRAREGPAEHTLAHTHTHMRGVSLALSVRSHPPHQPASKSERENGDALRLFTQTYDNCLSLLTRLSLFP